MRIGILQADFVREELRKKFGDYSGMFTEVLTAVSREPIEFAIFEVVNGQYPKAVNDCDGYVITGSHESVYDQSDWIIELKDFVHELNETKKKTVGICFGHQLIAHTLGGLTGQASKGWGVGIHSFEIHKRQTWMGSENSFRLICSHQDQVQILPEQAYTIASSPFCPYASYGIDKHFLTFQGHPEFSIPYAKALLHMRKDILKDAFEPAILSMRGAHDALLVARWMIDFWRG